MGNHWKALIIDMKYYEFYSIEIQYECIEKVFYYRNALEMESVLL